MNATETLQALSAPFEPSDVHWKPQHVTGNRALAVAYIDARAVMDRLDDVCALGWSETYDVLPDGSVVCRLRVQLDGQWIERSDAGSPSEQPDGGDRMKAAFSDALKRAAVKFGIGRYLYRLPKQWVDFDAQKKVLKSQPQLPAWAVPAPRQPKAATTAIGKSQPAATITHEQAKQLQHLLQANRTIDPAKFLARFQVKRLTQLPAGMFQDAVTTLNNPPQQINRTAA